MTYAGCPDCYAKVGDAVTITGQVECLKCRKIVPLSHYYFFRCLIRDNSGSIQVGFARHFATDLMDGMSAGDFRRRFRDQASFNEYC